MEKGFKGWREVKPKAEAGYGGVSSLPRFILQQMKTAVGWRLIQDTAFQVISRALDIPRDENLKIVSQSGRYIFTEMAKNEEGGQNGGATTKTLWRIEDNGWPVSEFWQDSLKPKEDRRRVKVRFLPSFEE